MSSIRDTADAERLADRIAAAVAGCPLVARLAASSVATYLPSRTVQGVAIREGEARIAVVAVYGPPVAEIARQVRTAVRPLLPGARIDVMIDDIDLPGDDPGRPR